MTRDELLNRLVMDLPKWPAREEQPPPLPGNAAWRLASTNTWIVATPELVIARSDWLMRRSEMTGHLGIESWKVDIGMPISSTNTARHYRHAVRVPVTQADLDRGYAVFKLDPYRVCDVYATGGGPREQMIKKLLRWTDKGQSEKQVLDEIQAALARWREMRAEDAAAGREGGQ